MITIKATLTVDGAPQPAADPALDAHVKTLRPRQEQPDPEAMQRDTQLLRRIISRLEQMGHGTSIAAQMLEMTHGGLLSKLYTLKRGGLVSLAPCTPEAAELLLQQLLALPDTAEQGVALLQRALDAYGKGGIGTLKSLADYLGISYPSLFQWRQEPPKRIKIGHLMALHRLELRGVLS